MANRIWRIFVSPPFFSYRLELGNVPSVRLSEFQKRYERWWNIYVAQFISKAQFLRYAGGPGLARSIAGAFVFVGSEINEGCPTSGGFPDVGMYAVGSKSS